jgi:hypothetical protein
MSVFSSIRKGFSFFLMSMGVSTYPRKGTISANEKPVPPAVPPKSPE